MKLLTTEQKNDLLHAFGVSRPEETLAPDQIAHVVELPDGTLLVVEVLDERRGLEGLYANRKEYEQRFFELAALWMREPGKDGSIFDEILGDMTSFPDPYDILQGLSSEIGEDLSLFEGAFGRNAVRRLAKKLQTMQRIDSSELVKWICLYITEAVRREVGGEIVMTDKEGRQRLLRVDCGRHSIYPARTVLKALADEPKLRLFRIFQIECYECFRAGEEPLNREGQ